MQRGRHLPSLVLAAGLAACGPYVTHTVQSGSIRHLPTGVRLIRVRPAVPDSQLDVALGGTYVPSEPAEGEFGSPLYTDHTFDLAMGYHGQRTGVAMHWSFSMGDPEKAASPDLPAAPDGSDIQFGVRLHHVAGGDRLLLGLLLEAGIRGYRYREHIVERCLHDGGFTSCREVDLWDEDEHGHGGSTEDFELYLTPTLLPAVHLGAGHYVYVGVGLDNLTTGWQMTEVSRYESDNEEEYFTKNVLPVYAGFDLALADRLSALLNVQVPFSSVGARPTYGAGLALDL